MEKSLFRWDIKTLRKLVKCCPIYSIKIDEIDIIQLTIINRFSRDKSGIYCMSVVFAKLVNVVLSK